MSKAQSLDDEVVVTVDEDLEDIVPGYLENRREEVVSLKNAIEAGEYDKVRVIGHTLKGTGGGYGFDELTSIGSRLEIAGAEAKRDDMETALFELSDYLRRVRVVYEQE